MAYETLGRPRRKRREYGPWSETFGTRSTQWKALYANWYRTGSPSWITQHNVMSDDAKFGVYARRLGYNSPKGARQVVRPASLTKVVHHVLARASDQWYWPSGGYYMASKDYPCNIKLLTSSMGSILAAQKGSLDSSARTKLMKRAKSDLQILPILGEARETGRYIADRAKGISSGLQQVFSSKRLENLSKAWKRDSYQRSTSIIKSSSELWLETVFSLRPMVNDIAMGLVALDEMSLLNRCKAVGKMTFDRSYNTQLQIDACSGDPAPGATNTHFKVVLTAVMREAYDVKYGMTWNPDPGDAFYQALGVNWQDVLPSLYELMPYSFVLEYFSNLGDILSSYSFDWTVWSNKYKTSFTKRQIDYSFMPVAPGAYTTLISRTIGQGKLESITFNRSAESGFELPKFELKAPSLAQSANLVALAGARVERAIKIVRFM